jgi:hypothetical protein
MKVALATGFALLLVLLTACGEREGPQQAIHGRIAELETALAERSPGGVLDILAESFLGGSSGQLDMDREGAKKMLAVYFLRYRRIRAVVTQVAVEVDPYEPRLARATARVTLAGGESLLPNSAGFYQVESRWQEIDGDWQITRLQWH